MAFRACLQNNFDVRWKQSGAAPFYGGISALLGPQIRVFFVRTAVVSVLVSAAMALSSAVFAQAANKHKPGQKTQAVATPVQTRAVTYEPDGTPVATGAPRRLSTLAVPGHHTLALNRPAKHKAPRPPL
jgi:hypothetical protein